MSERPIPIERDGRIDALLRYGDFRLGVEFKVCVLPRQRDLSPKRVLYDIGQISLDHGCLKHYSINSAYCIVILYGRLFEMSGTTRQRVVRHFHNAMFVDYHTSMEFGELSSECSDRERRFQIQSIKEIGFDHPFPPDHRKVRPYDFCQLNNRLNVAVVGLWVK